MSIKFEFVRTNAIPSSHIAYDEGTYSLDFSPQQTILNGVALVNEVEISIADDSAVNAIYGWCPRNGWKEARVEIPTSDNAIVKILTDHPPGVLSDITHGVRWDTFYDPAKKVLQISTQLRPELDMSIRAMSGVVLAFKNNSLVAMWLSING